MTLYAAALSNSHFRSSDHDSLAIIIPNQTRFGDDMETINLQDCLFYGGATRFINKLTCRTFTASQDCLTIPIRVYPVIPVNHLISFTGLDLTARFSRKLLNGAKGDCVIKKEIL